MARLSEHLESFKKDLIKEPRGCLKYPYIVPAGPYSQLWDWDSFFVGVVLANYDGKAEALKYSVMNFLEFIKENGHTPWLVSPDTHPFHQQKGKPFLAQGTLIASQKLDDFKWIPPIYSKLERSLQFWEKERNYSSLFFWMDGFESGSDNNPAVFCWPALTVCGVDLNCFLYREYLAMALISKRLGHAEACKRYNQKARDLAEFINRKMWSEKDSTYYNLFSGRNFIEVKTWTNFLPLWAKIAPKDRAEKMIEKYLLNTEEFLSRFGIRSLSKRERRWYNQEDVIIPYSNYQGPVWVHINYLLAHGLNNYGYKAEAVKLADKIERLLLRAIKTTGYMHECYNAETGKVTKTTQGFVSWNILAEHLKEELKNDYDPTKLKRA